MINFRFHLVSLIAVFLALAVGVVVGSTVIDRAIVDGLESQIDRVERNVSEARQESSDLRSRLHDVEQYAEQVSPLAVQGRLIEVPVTLLAVRGVDDGTVRAAVDVLRDAGADVPAVLWLEPAWDLSSEEQRETIRDLVDGPDMTAATARRALIRQLAERLAVPAAEVPAAQVALTRQGDDPASSSTTSSAVEREPGEEVAVDLLVAMVETDFLSVETVGGPDVDLTAYPPAGARAVVVDRVGGDVQAETLLVPLVTALDAVGVPTLAASVDRGGDDPPGAVLAGVRGDAELSDRVATVDSLQSIRGRVALVAALERLGDGDVGHYGAGDRASRQVPEVEEVQAG
ncbi:MAG TPA: copper transporter [Acidimicrobiia bacterium]|nr:copper transporter [Acidimicrobiia bacterium]